MQKVIYPAKSEIKPVSRNSKKFLVLSAMLKGVTVEDIAKLTGWSKSAAASCIATDIAPLGYRVSKEGTAYFVKLPKGRKRPVVRT